MSTLKTDGSTSRTTVRGLFQAKHGYFDITTPIYEGDLVEVADPRGGIDKKYAAAVLVNEMSGMSNLEHISVTLGKPPTNSVREPQVVYNAPVINVHGNPDTACLG